MEKVKVLFVNVGTPQHPTRRGIAKFLRSFLTDRRVIPLPFVLRWILVNFIIVPFRSEKVAKLYRSIWRPKGGSPLSYFSQKFVSQVSANLGTSVEASFAMSYGNPSLAEVVNACLSHHPQALIVVPLFPQYASATVGAVMETILKTISVRDDMPNLTCYHSFYFKDFFIDAIVNKIQMTLQDVKNPDALLLSYHGLPKEEMEKAGGLQCCRFSHEACPRALSGCYRSQCFETSRLISKKLNMFKGETFTVFQSRFGRKVWIQPYLSQKLQDLRHKGVENIAVACPSFVADCLETLEEIDIRLRAEWLELGGKQFTFIPCLNDDKLFVRGISQEISQLIQTFQKC